MIKGYSGTFLKLGSAATARSIAWLASGQSFRRVPDRALIRDGAELAVVRGIVQEDGRLRQTDVELHAAGRNRILLNGHPAARTRDLAGSLRVTLFAPDEPQLVKGGPAERRESDHDALEGPAVDSKLRFEYRWRHMGVATRVSYGELERIGGDLDAARRAAIEL